MEFKPLDTFLLNGSLARNFACAYSSDDQLLVMAEAGCYVVALKPQLSNKFSILGCKKFLIRPSTYTISDKVGIDINEIIIHLPKDQIYTTLLRNELSATIHTADPIEATPLCALWSPKGLVNKSKCALAILSSLHSLEIYLKSLDHTGMTKYIFVTNLTEHIISERQQVWKDAKRLSLQNTYSEYLRRIESIAPTAFCWGNIYSQDETIYSVIFVGHFDGSISVWKIPEITVNENVNCIFLGRYNTKLGQIFSLYWHRTSQFGGGLCMGDNLGKVSIVQIKNLNTSEAFIGNEVEFWSKHDAAVDKILVVNIKNYTILIAVKQANLLFFPLDLVGNVFDFVVHNVKNFYITGVEFWQDSLYVQTFDGPLKELKIEIEMQNLKLYETCVPMKIDLTKYRCHGFIFSPNKVFLAVLLYPKYYKHHLRVLGKIIVEFWHNAAVKPFEILMAIENASLENYWDCFEVLRLLCLKEKRFPWLGLSSTLNYDSLSLQKLKVLRLVSKISETVYSSISRVYSYNIKPYILIHYLVNIKLSVRAIENLLKLRENGVKLSKFQLQSMFQLNLFLKEMVLSGILAKANVGKTFIDEICTVMEICNELEYPEMPQCWSCGERILGPTCLPPHADSRCCITMMPIMMVPAFQCNFCQSMAHPEVVKDMNPVVCPYCDIPMDKISVSKNLEKILDSTENYLRNGEVRSFCFQDCLQETYDIDNLEENEIEYVIFSESEEETEKSGKNSSNDKEGCLKELYTKVTNMTVSEIKSIAEGFSVVELRTKQN